MEVAEPHPETPDRIINILSILKRGDIRKSIDWRDGRYAERSEVERFHTAAYIDEVLEAEKRPPTRIDGSGTVINAGSVDAAFAAAGTTIAAVNDVLAKNLSLIHI